jgi:hypothetical protein
MTRQSIGEALAVRLFAAETAIDLALTETANLASALPAARADAYLSAVTGQRAFDGAAASIGALAEARSHLVQTHNTLAALARKLGLETLAIGPLDKPADRPPVGGGGGDSQGVAAELVNESLSNALKKVLPDTLKLC